jgi:hypothetical protein
VALTIATALVAATALALGGRGGGDDAADAGSTAGPPRATATFNARDAVMALSDLPSGWAVDPDDDDEEDENDFFCGEDLDAVVEPEEVNEAQAQFAQGGSIPLLINAVGAYAPGDADVAFDKFEEIVADCSSFEDEGTTFEVAPVSFPEQGDESVPLLLSAEVEGLAVSLYLVVVRIADGITIVGYGGLGPDVAEVEKYVSLAVTKLEQAQGVSP